jgi:hypothetical protein
MNEMMSSWTIVEKNVRMFTVEGPMLWNRLLWVGVRVADLNARFPGLLDLVAAWTPDGH